MPFYLILFGAITNLKSGANYQNKFLDMAQMTFFFRCFWCKLHTPDILHHIYIIIKLFYKLRFLFKINFFCLAKKSLILKLLIYFVLGIFLKSFYTLRHFEYFVI